MNRNRPGSRLRSGLVVIATGLSTLFPPPLEGAAPRAEDRRHRHVCSPAPALSPEEAELRRAAAPLAPVPRLLGTRLPPRVDWRGELPPVIEQPDQMSCVATAGGYYQRNQTEKHFRHPEWDLGDPRYRFSPKICYRFGGVGFADKVQQALWVWGSVDWAELPFTPERITEYPSPAQLEAAKPYRTGGYAAIWNRMGATYPLVPPNPIDQAKAWLAEGYTLSVDINPENPHYPDNGPGHVPYNPYFDPGFITGTPGHGVAIVGYDDDANPYGTTPDHRGGFLVVNSHGPDWNGPMKGFVWMSYDYAKRFVTYAWIQLPGAPDEPVITGASQRELNVGDSVTLTGHGFGALRRSAGVTFNGVLATDVSFTDEAVTATVPAGATSGPVVVSNGNGIPSNPFHLDLAVLPPVRILPIVLDVTSGTARFTTEVTLTNRGRKAVSAALRYQVSLGGPAGSGEVTEPLAAGEQEVIPDVLAFLRTKGLPIPAGNQGGQLIVRFIGADGESVVAASARTTTPAASPGPEGTLGLAYAAVPPSHLTGFGPLTVFGLRSNATDRSNLAVFNPQPAPVRVKVTAYDGKGSENLFEVIRDEETIPPYGWVQYSGVLDWSVSGQGWVTVEPLIPGSPFGVYGVVNDNTTHDGSFLPPSPADLGGGRMTVPVLVETATLSSELVLANNGGFEAYLTLQFGERTSGTPGVTFILYPKKQLIIPDAIEQLRKWHLPIGPRGAADYAGALHLTVRRAQNGHIFAAARTTSGSSAGGRVGVFTPAVVESQMASTETYLHGLKADARTRTNVALVNTGLFEEGPVALELRAFDGDAGGAESGQPQVVVLGPGAWRQLDGFLEQQGVANGWVRVARVVGSAPWLAYAVVNDGAAPGAGSGDGAYVAMSGPQP